MFNVTKVNSQIRNSSRLQWYREGGKDYVVNGYWAIKANLEEERYRKILGLLVELFGSIPVEKKGIIREKWGRKINFKEILTKPDWFSFIDEQDSATKLTDTRLIFENTQHYKMRLFAGADYIYVNCDYIEMIKSNEINARGSKKLSPVYLAKEDDLFMIMPVRMCENSEYLKVLRKEKASLDHESNKANKEYIYK